MDQSFVVGLCHRLYNFIANYLTTYATKTVTLGHGSHQPSADQLPSLGAPSAISSGSVADQATQVMAQETPLKDASLQPYPAHDPNEVQEMGDTSLSSAPSKEDEAAESTAEPEAQPPKKTVSINDTVEEMIANMNKSKKKKRTEKMGSFDQEIDETKPLKSILKVGSKLDENPYMNRSSSLGST